MDSKKQKCFACGEDILEKDVIALNRKLYGEKIEKVFCLPCLAESLGVEIDELLEKIEDFKAEGCKLFS